MDIRSDVLAMDERTYRLWANVAKGSSLVPSPEAATKLVPAKRSVGSVAVIPLTGFLTQKPTLFSMLFGGTSVQAFAREVVAALADPSVGAVVMEVDSPGGETFGVTEAATAIREARGGKPLVAVASPVAASAAYWLAAQADEIVATPSGLVGSVGVFTVHVDQSKALAQAGITMTFISYGDRKTDGNPAEPLSEEALASVQAMVDEVGRQFEADVAKGRKVTAARVHEDYGRGGILTASQALAAGVIDRIGTLDEVVGKMAAGYKPKGTRACDETELRALAILGGLEVR